MERFHLEPAHFPAATRELFSVDMLLRHGALPLGFKTRYRFLRAVKILNVGLVEPKRKDVARAVESEARAAIPDIAGIQIFAIDPAEFLAILGKVYGVTDETLRSRADLPAPVREKLAPAV